MSPKNTDPLERLRREHAEALLFADRLETTAREGDEAALAEAVKLVQSYNREEMEGHLQHEEQRVLSVLAREHPEHLPLCFRLGREHGELRSQAADIGLGNPGRTLAGFASLLRKHTRTEDEQLLPLVESLFTATQQEAILDFKPPPSPARPGH